MTGEQRGVPGGAAAVASRPTRHVIVMGVSGSGKSTVATGISERTGLCFVEADDFHSPANVAKMRSGIPLDDTDRWPWLRDLAAWMAERAAEGVSTVLACSALRRAYRDVLRDGLHRDRDGLHRDRGVDGPVVEFVHLDGSAEVIRDRMAHRPGHYMPPSLLDSQVATLEPLQPDERGVVLDVAHTPQELVDEAVEALHLPDPHQPAPPVVPERLSTMEHSGRRPPG